MDDKDKKIEWVNDGLTKFGKTIKKEECKYDKNDPWNTKGRELHMDGIKGNLYDHMYPYGENEEIRNLENEVRDRSDEIHWLRDVVDRNHEETKKLREQIKTYQDHQGCDTELADALLEAERDLRNLQNRNKSLEGSIKRFEDQIKRNELDRIALRKKTEEALTDSKALAIKVEDRDKIVTVLHGRIHSLEVSLAESNRVRNTQQPRIDHLEKCLYDLNEQIDTVQDTNRKLRKLISTEANRRAALPTEKELKTERKLDF